MWHGFAGLGILWGIEPLFFLGLYTEEKGISARIKVGYVIEKEESWGEREAEDVSTRMLRFGFELVKGWLGAGAWFYVETQIRWETYRQGNWKIREKVFEERRGGGVSLFLVKRYKTLEFHGGLDWRRTLTPYFSMRKNF